MPTIMFPDVPQYPGVPALVRGVDVPTGISVALGAVTSVLASALQSPSQWGIFDAETNAQLGAVAQGNGLFISILQAIAPGPILSTNAFEFVKDTKVSDFPVENGGFASYNKVTLPKNPVVTLVLAGSQSDRTNFLNQIEAACNSTTLYNVVTPEVTYTSFTLERYSYIRRSYQGATLLMVEIALKEIREVSATYSTVQTPTSINQPQNPDATPQTNSGSVQPAAPTQSTLSSIAQQWPALGSMLGAN